MQTQLSEEDLSIIYNWVDEIPLSRPKKNISRDFADGVLIAEIVNTYNPQIIELHNYVAASSVKKKRYNWETLNKKVFKKLGFQMSPEQIDQIVNSVPESIEIFLKLLKGRVEGYQGNSPKRNDSQNMSQQQNQQGQAFQNMEMSQQVSHIMQEKDQAIYELRETIDILEEKIRKMDELIKIKDNKLLAMQRKMQDHGII